MTWSTSTAYSKYQEGHQTHLQRGDDKRPAWKTSMPCTNLAFSVNRMPRTFFSPRGPWRRNLSIVLAGSARQVGWYGVLIFSVFASSVFSWAITQYARSESYCCSLRRFGVSRASISELLVLPFCSSKKSIQFAGTCGVHCTPLGPSKGTESHQLCSDQPLGAYDPKGPHPKEKMRQAACRDGVMCQRESNGEASDWLSEV